MCTHLPLFVHTQRIQQVLKLTFAATARTSEQLNALSVLVAREKRRGSGGRTANFEL